MRKRILTTVMIIAATVALTVTGGHFGNVNRALAATNHHHLQTAPRSPSPQAVLTPRDRRGERPENTKLTGPDDQASIQDENGMPGTASPEIAAEPVALHDPGAQAHGPRGPPHFGNPRRANV